VRVALAGKGGAGKTTIAATLARLRARQGRQVAAVDADSNPNLGAALGVAPGGEPGFLPAGLVARRLDGPALRQPLPAVLEAYGAPAPDGVRLLRMGMPAHADEGCLCVAHATVSALLGDLGAAAGVDTFVDLEASPEHLSRGTARHVDTLLLVAEPYYRSLETVRRLAALAAELPIPTLAVVANKLRSTGDAAAVREFCDRHRLALAAEVPWSEAVLEADASRTPLLDHAPGSAAAEAAAALLRSLVAVSGVPPARR
jgi:CO dehydrogenase maturation factor